MFVLHFLDYLSIHLSFIGILEIELATARKGSSLIIYLHELYCPHFYYLVGLHVVY